MCERVNHIFSVSFRLVKAVYKFLGGFEIICIRIFYVTYNNQSTKRRQFINYTFIITQCDSVGTRHKKMRISQRLFIRF